MKVYSIYSYAGLEGTPTKTEKVVFWLLVVILVVAVSAITAGYVYSVTQPTSMSL